MQAELKQKWVEALRSGKYQQGKAMLRSRDGEFCCLGVLCDLVAPSAWEFSPVEGCFMVHGRSGYIPAELLLTVGASGLDDDGQERLVDMNDNGASFADIAGFIEQNIPADAS